MVKLNFKSISLKKIPVNTDLPTTIESKDPSETQASSVNPVTPKNSTPPTPDSPSKEPPPPSTSTPPAKPDQADPKFPQAKKFKKLKKPLLIFLIIFLVCLTYGLLAALLIKSPAVATSQAVKASFTALQNKNLAEAETNLDLAQANLVKLQSKFKLIGWVRFIPLLGTYVNDAHHGLIAAGYGLEAADLIFEAIKPYADVLGLEGVDAELNIQSAEDKLIFILETLDKISPKLDDVGQKIALVEAEISHINPRHYPKSLAGKPLRSQIITLQQSLQSTKDTLGNIKPLLTLLPKLLGQEEPQKYLLVFQNDAELRGSGGFLTAYAILETHRGKITPLLSDDIYHLDDLFGNRLPAPEEIKKYLPLVYSWHLRDMNLSPDFTVSMDTFFPNYQKVAQHKAVDGIIAMDTQIVVDLLKVLGKVGVANWGEYNAEIIPECNCPQVVYKMEDYATRPTYYIKEDRKGMIGPLMHSILLNVMNSPKKLWPQFIDIGLKNIKAKHLMFYFPEDEAMQEVADAFKASGRVDAYDQDYFYLNDTNFAGAKSNLYVEQEITQDIEVASDGTITKTATIIYTNPEPQDDCNLETGGLCLNGLLRDWVRILVPEGSEIVEVLGSDIDATTSKDLGKTIIEAFIELRPESKTKLIVKYTLPFKYQSGDYNLLIQKQPGAKNHHYTVNLKNTTEEFDLDQDKELIL